MTSSAFEAPVCCYLTTGQTKTNSYWEKEMAKNCSLQENLYIYILFQFTNYLYFG